MYRMRIMFDLKLEKTYRCRNKYYTQQPLAGLPGLRIGTHTTSKKRKGLTYSMISPFDLLVRNMEPITKVIDATIIGYQSPASGSPDGLLSVLLNSNNDVASKGV